MECPDPERVPERVPFAQGDLDIAVVEELLLAAQNIVGQALRQLKGEQGRAIEAFQTHTRMRWMRAIFRLLVHS